MIELQRGEKRKLAELVSGTTPQVQVRQDFPGADVSVFGLNADRKLQDDRYFVFYNQLASPEGAIQLSQQPEGGSFALDLARLPSDVTRLAFVATHDEAPFSRMSALVWTLTGGGGEGAQITLRGADFAQERAIIIAELYLHNGEWRVSNVAQGFNGGLQAVLEYFGGEVAQEAAPPAQPTPAASPPTPPAVATPFPDTPSQKPPVSKSLGTDDVTRPSYSLTEWLGQTAEADRPGDVFELESSKMLEVKVRGRVWSKLGAMVAYKGNLSFKRQGMLEGGVMKALMRAVTKEMEPLAKIEGQGTCYLADEEKEITIIKLAGDAINVNGNDLLAFEDTVTHTITMHRRVAGMMSGGLFSVRCQGNGMVAILSHGEPLTLRVTPGEPISTDPNATVAWSENLSPQLRMDASMRSIFGRGGGETFQMVFQGEGFVIVQPFEENVRVAQRQGGGDSNPLGNLFD